LPIPFLVGMALVPDSPRFMFMKGKPKEAERALQWLRKSDEDISAELKVL